MRMQLFLLVHTVMIDLSDEVNSMLTIALLPLS